MKSGHSRERCGTSGIDRNRQPTAVVGHNQVLAKDGLQGVQLLLKRLGGLKCKKQSSAAPNVSDGNTRGAHRRAAHVHVHMHKDGSRTDASWAAS